MPSSVFHGLVSELPTEVLFDGSVVRTALKTDGSLVSFNFCSSSMPEIPEHEHPYDQLTLCFGGRMEVTVAGTPYVVGDGGFLYIPRDLPHSGRHLSGDPLLSVDLFAPAREDWLYLADAQPD